MQQRCFLVGDLTVNAETRTVVRDGTVLPLRGLSFDVFLELVEKAPETVTAEVFARSVWRSDHISDETLTQRIRLVRRVLDDDPIAPRYIRTVRARGYALAAKVEPMRELPKEEGSSRTDAAHPHLLLAIIASIGLLAATSALIGKYHTEDDEKLGTHKHTASELLIGRATNQLALHTAENTQNAIDLLDRALEKDPSNYEARLQRSVAFSTSATKFGGTQEMKTEARRLAEALIAERPEDSNAWAAYGYALGALGRLDESLQAYRQAYTLDPYNASALSSAAYTSLIQGNIYDALQLELRAKNIGGATRYAETQIALALDLVGHPASASWHDKAMELNPRQAVVISEVARFHLRRNEPQSAQKVLSSVRGSDRDAPIILQLQGRAAINLGRYNAAREYFEKCGGYCDIENAALQGQTGDKSVLETFLRGKIVTVASNPEPAERVRLAELAASLGDYVSAQRLVEEAVSLGWRDERWLLQSVYLRPNMKNDRASSVGRIRRHRAAQLRLILQDTSLEPILSERR